MLVHNCGGSRALTSTDPLVGDLATKIDAAYPGHARLYCDQLRKNADRCCKAMNTLLLLVERGSAWSPETWVLEQGGERNAFGEAVIERRPEWITVGRDDDVLNDYEAEELPRLAELISGPAIYVIEWGGHVLVENLLRAVPPEINAVVDNDCGVIVSVHEVADKSLDSWVTAKNLP